MNFDDLTTKPCIAEVPDPAPAVPTVDTPDGEDPDNTQPILILKPGFTLAEPGTNVQFRTYLLSDDGVETEVTTGLSYRSSDHGIVTIGAASGKGSTAGAGIVSISVEWQDMMAYAEVQVVGSCQNVNVGMAIIIDNSRSMGQVFTEPPVGAGQTAYATKLSYARALAHAFAGDLNPYKDQLSVWSFNSSPNLEEDLPVLDTQTKINETQDAILQISQTQEGTDLEAAFEDAKNQLEAAEAAGTIDRHAIIILSDGEASQGSNPIALANTYKSTGGSVICVGFRAHGDGFKILRKMATEGMFLNALKGNTDTTGLLLRGFKGYFCAGNCLPEGGETAFVAALNYTAFENFDVGGVVDLIGGVPPNELFDLIPGNGLYVDLSGSSEPWRGSLQSKTAFNVEAGKTYKISVWIAGNQRSENTGYQVTTRFLNPEDSVFAVETIDDWDQDFTLYEYEFVAPSTDTGKVYIEQSATPDFAFGNLLSRVKFENVTDAVDLLDDDFDGENEVFIADPCPNLDSGGGYGYTKCYGFGCPSDAPEEQAADTDPHPVLEPLNFVP